MELLHAATCKPPHEVWRATYERIPASKLKATTGAAASMEDVMQLRGEDTRECPTLIGDDNENPSCPRLHLHARRGSRAAA